MDILRKNRRTEEEINKGKHGGGRNDKNKGRTHKRVGGKK